MRSAVSDEVLDFAVPIPLESDWATREMIVNGILELYHSSGLRRFMLFAPCKGWRTIGLPPEDVYRRLAVLAKTVKDDLSPYGISIGWWISLSLKSGPSPGFTRMLDFDGNLSPFGICPRDEGFSRLFAERAALFCEIAQPDFIFIEDDYCQNASAWPFGCCCDLHMAEFARRKGRSYTREELKTIFQSGTREGYALLKEWVELQKDSMVAITEQLRSTIDRKNPEIPIGMMQPGGADRDGDITECVARAAAGKNHVPFSRLFGTFYCGEKIGGIPESLFHPLYSVQHIPQPFRFYHESDTYPHTSFYTSGTCMRILMGNAYAMGFHGSTFQAQQGMDDPNEEHAYSRMFAAERKRFEAVARIARTCEIKGVYQYFDPFWSSFVPESGPDWTTVISHFGIPYSTLPSGVSFVSGNQPRFWEDDMVRNILSGTVFLDGQAAEVLYQRGYGELLGVRVEKELFTARDKYDFEGREIICEGFSSPGKGRNMHRQTIWCPYGNGRSVKLICDDPACEMVTEIVSFRHEFMAPGMTLFTNRLGGNVIILACTVRDNLSSCLFNYRRQRLIQELIIRFRDEFVMAKEHPRTFVVMSEAREPDAPCIGMAVLTALNPDPIDELPLHLPPAWRKAETFRFADQNGEWQELAYRRTDDGIVITQTLLYGEPLYLLAVK